MEKPKKVQKCPPKRAWEFAEDVYFSMSAASPSEFTGLTPTVPETEVEAEAYRDLMEVPITAKDGSEAYDHRIKETEK